jgi:hypothetical protein
MLSLNEKAASRFILFIILFHFSCNTNNKMKEVKTIHKDEIQFLLSRSNVVNEELAVQFKVMTLENKKIIGLHFKEDWAFLSNDRKRLNLKMREYLINQGTEDGYDSPLAKNAKKIIRNRKQLTKEFCDYLSISTQTDLSCEAIQAIDDLIKKKTYKEVYEKYCIELGVFIGEILIKKTKGKWFLKTVSGIFVTYEIPIIKTPNGQEHSPWRNLDRYYREDTSLFSLYSSITTVTEGFGVYQKDFNQN